jgi:hypothetical protein
MSTRLNLEVFAQTSLPASTLSVSAPPFGFKRQLIALQTPLITRRSTTLTAPTDLACFQKLAQHTMSMFQLVLLSCNFSKRGGKIA